MKIARTLLAVVALAGASAPAYAAVNLVTNGSFETIPGSELPFGCGADCSFSSESIPGWVSSGATGQFRPGPPSTTTFFNSVPDGITTAYSNGGSISQTLGVSAVAGRLYSLTLSFGRRADGFFDPTASAILNVGGTLVTATGVAPTAGNWSVYTASYFATALDAGKSISVILNAAGPQGNWDNVAVVASVPEPATWALMILGFGIVGSALRRRKTKVRFNFA